MSKRKGNEKGTEQPPNKWPIGEVMETARMLYTVEPFDLFNAAQFKVLVWKANIFLDNLHAACKAPAFRPPTITGFRLETDLLPVDEGVRNITERPRTKEAMRNFRTFVCYLATPQNAATAPAQAERFKAFTKTLQGKAGEDAGSNARTLARQRRHSVG